MERKILYAEEGTVLTDGKVYGKVIYLAESADGAEFYSISDGEYAEILAREAELDPVVGGGGIDQ